MVHWQDHPGIKDFSTKNITAYFIMLLKKSFIVYCIHFIISGIQPISSCSLKSFMVTIVVSIWGISAYVQAYFIMLLKKSFIVYCIHFSISGIFSIIYVIYCCVSFMYRISLSHAIIDLFVLSCLRAGFSSIEQFLYSQKIPFVS